MIKHLQKNIGHLMRLFLLLALFYFAAPPNLQAQNNALHFDGTDDYVDCNSFAPTSFTVEAWVNPDRVNVDQAIVSTLTTVANTGFEMHIGANGIPIITLRNGSSWVDINGTGLVNAGEWFHMTLTFDGSTCKVYVNGVQTASSSVTSFTPGTSSLNIGRRSEGNYPFSGIIDEVRVWNTALTQAEIITDMSNSLTGSETGLYMYYNFNQGTAEGDNSSVTTLTDATATANNGTLTNFALTGTTSNWVGGFTTDNVSYSLTTSSTEVGIERASGSTTTFSITSNTNWSIADESDWLDLDVTSGTGNAIITLTANETNTTNATRSIELVITGTNAANDTVTVTQQRGTISVSGNPTLSAAAGSTITFTITSNIDWTIAESSDWFSVNPTSGSGNATITVTSDLLNSSIESRNANLVISGTNAEDVSVSVTQNAATIALSRTTIDIDATSNSQSFFNITTDVDWQATCSASWLSLDKTSGSGNDAMTLTAEALPDGVTERYANIVFSGVFEPAGVIVTQKVLPNNALSFDGSNDYVVCDPVAPTQFTAEAWIYLNNVSGYKNIVSNFSNTKNFMFRVVNNQLYLYLGLGSSSTSLNSTSTIESNKWYHVAATYDGSVAKLYINGVQEASTLYTTYFTTLENVPLYIGAEPGNYFNGKMDDVRLWSVARSTDEINSDLSNQTTDNTGLLAWYNFNQGEANGDNANITKLYDASGNLNDGTLTNFALNGTASNWVDGASGKLLSANATTTGLTADAGNTTISVQSNTSWSLSTDANWLTPDITTGNDDATVTLTYSANSGNYYERSATVTLTAQGLDTVFITFTQQPEKKLIANFTADNTRLNIIPASVTFTDASTATNTTITNWNWNFGDGTTSNDQNPVHTYTDYGNYTVTLIISDETGADTLVKTDYITVSTDVLMANGSVTISDSLYFYDSGGENNGYENNERYTMVFYPQTPGSLVKIDFISFYTENNYDKLYIYDGTNTSATRLALNTGTTYTSSVQATNANGALCVYFYSDISSVYSGWKALVTEVLPKAAFTESDNVVLINSDITFTDASIMAGLNAWSWDFSDGTTSTDQNPTHAYTAAGTYTVTLNASNGTVSKTATSEIQVVDGVTANFTTDVTSGYQPTVQFTNTSIDATSYSWNFGDGSEASTDENPTHTFYTAGTYTVTLTATDASSNSSEFATEITANTIIPAFTADKTSGYQPTIQFTDTTTGATSWSWDFGDGSDLSTLQNPSHTYTTAGNYTISLTVSDGYNTETLQKQDYITVNPFNVMFSADITSGYLPTVEFTDQSNGTGITSWEWDFGDGYSSTEQNPIHAYTTAGVYPVTLIVSDGTQNCTTTKQDYIYTDRILMSNQSITIADGVAIPFYDSGNNTGQYLNFERYTLVLYPTETGKAVKIDFSSFISENCCDYLNIYDGTSTSATLLATQKGSSYTSTITATNTSGALCLYFYSDGSVIGNGWEALITQVNLDATITWPTPATITYGNAIGSGVMNATANISGTFSYNFSSDSVFSAGTHTLTVTFTPDDNLYQQSTQTVTYTVNKASLVATADNITLAVGSAIPELTFTYAGFVNGDDVSDLDLAPVATTNVTTTSNAGDYTIYVLAGFDKNYEITYQQGTLTLTTLQVPTITWANPDDIIYGTALDATQLNATASVAGTFSYSPAAGSLLNVGNAKALNVTFTPTDVNTYASASKVVTINVGKANLTATVENLSKTYGDANPQLSISYTGFVSPDYSGMLQIIPEASTLATTDSPVGTYAINITEGYHPNYNITCVPGTLTINQRNLTLSSFTADNKIYDGTTTVTGTGFSDDRINDDVLTFAYDAAFETKTAGSDKTVNYLNIAISGADAGNYTLASTTGSVTANITTKEVTIGGSFAASSKIYDATTAVSIITNNLTLTGIVDGDVVSLTAVAAFEQATVGTGVGVSLSTATTLIGADAANYSLSMTGAPASNADITPATLTITGLQAESKVYDGHTDANFSGGVLSGIIGTDEVYTGMPFTGTFAQSSVGTDIPVLAGAMIIEGTDANNYVLTQPTYMVANITARSLYLTNFTADSKIYDGTTAVTGTGFNDDRVSGDEITFSYDAAFENKTVGTNKTVNFTNIAISGGADAGNYTLETVSGSSSASITAKELTVGGIVAANKVYDGTAVATLSGATINGLIDGDEAALANATSGTFAQTTVGASVAVTTNINLSGNDAGNYALVQPLGVTANITPASLTVTANSITKTKGQAYTFTGAEFSTSAMFGSDAVNSVTLTSDGALSSAAEGEYPIVASNASGLGLGNYSITYVDGKLTVTAKQLPVITWSTPAGIVYGTALSSDQLNATADIPGTFAYSPSIGSVLNAGSSQVLSVTFTPNDQDAYAEVTQSTTINVNKALLTVTADNQSIMVGSSIPQLTFQYDGFVNGDDGNGLDVRPTATTAATEESPVGEYPITVSGGSDSNYQFSYVEGTLYIIENPSLTVSTAELTIGAAANSTVDFTIASNVTWTISSAESWLSISSTSGTGDATITLSAEANPNTAERTAAVTVAGDGVESKTILVTQSAAVGINDNTLSAVKVYPNPASDLINVHLPDGLENVTVELLSINGVKLSVIETSGNVTPINVSALAKGIYILRITSANSNTIVRWIKN
ncbi:MAG: PKD domain-containing protein [Bacteroidales bacterium]